MTMSSSEKQTALKALIEPRLLTKAEAASYAGISMGNYDRLRKAGVMPTYVTGMLRIDRRALDAAIDRISTFKAPEAALTAHDVPDDPLTRWKQARAEQKVREADAMLRVEVVTKPRRDGGVTTTYYYQPTGQRLPNNRRSLAFRVALERCEQEAGKAVQSQKLPRL